MADLADLIQKLEYYKAGGKDPGQSTGEQFIQGFNTVKGMGDAYLGIVKQVLANKKAKIDADKTQLEAQKLKIENTPYVETYGTPSTKAGIALAENSPIPVEDLVSGNLNQRQKDIDYQKNRALELQNKYGNLTTGQVATMATAGLKETQANRLESDPTRKKMGELFPTLDDAGMKNQFGEGVTRETPYLVAIGLGKLNQSKLKNDRIFPVSALSQEGQAAAARAGLGDYIPETTARIINGANPIRLPSFEEATAVTTAQSIGDKLRQVSGLLPSVGDSALGFGKYQINKYGQYIPFMSTDPKISDFYTNINSINNAMVYLMSGKQINEQESKRIKSEMLEPELNKDAFVSRLDTVIRNYNYLNTLKTKAITNVGKRNPLSSGLEQKVKNGVTYEKRSDGLWHKI